MKEFDVAVYYRLNTDLAKVIAKSAYTFFTPDNGHRFQVACKVTDLAMAFAKANDGCQVMDLTYDELTGRCSSLYRGKARYVIIGVSLKEATLEDFKLLISSPFFYVSDVPEFIRNSERCKTANSNIYNSNGNFYYRNAVTIDRPIIHISDTEQEWLKLWEGFDHYYAYSDDGSVYRRWNNREKEIYAAGKKLGLTNDRMTSLYKSTF